MYSIKPSNLKEWANIDQSKAVTDSVPKSMEYIYGWYLSTDGKYYPHRKPTVNEILNNKFK